MKNQLFILSFAALAFGIAACQQPDPTPGGDDPKPGEVYNPYLEALPIAWSEGIAEGSEVGVTIEVKNVTNDNFVFELRPGASIQSFKLDVYPLSVLYNNLINDGMVGKADWEINEQIRTYIYNAEGNGGYTFSAADFESDPEEFLQMEFDWGNTAYAAASAIPIPDSDYIIAVVACTDTQASSSAQQDLTLCHVHTTSVPLIGDPSCELDVNIGYRKFSVQHIPNNDTKYIYFFGSTADQIDEYIDVCGDRMFRDFVRSLYTSPSDVSDPDALIYNYDFGQAADASLMNCTVAVCCDENMTPASTYIRRDFHLKEIPANADGADVEVKVKSDRTAAAYFEFDAIMQANCNTIFYRFYSQAAAEVLKNASDIERKLEAIDLLEQGYGCHNPNFSFDEDEQIPSGSAGTVTLAGFGGLMPGEVYCVGYVGRNAYGTPSELRFSDPFTLDTRNLDSPANCNVKDLKLTLSKPGRTQFKVDVEYDPNTVSVVYLQYMTADNNPGLDENSSWRDWVNFIFTSSSSGTGSMESSNLLVNAWQREESGRDGLTFTGMTPGTEYTIFLCAEDFDGNISEMQFGKISTNEIQVGADPTVNMTLEPSDNYPNDWIVLYTIDHDVAKMKYCYAEKAADLANYIPGLTQSAMNNIAESGIDYETWRQGIYDWVNELGMETESDTNQEWQGDGTVIAACLAVGKDETGAEVYQLFHLICKDGQAQTLEQIFGKE